MKEATGWGTSHYGTKASTKNKQKMTLPPSTKLSASGSLLPRIAARTPVAVMMKRTPSPVVLANNILPTTKGIVLVIVKWVKCDNQSCSRWVQVKYFTESSAVRRHNVCLCPHCA